MDVPIKKKEKLNTDSRSASEFINVCVYRQYFSAIKTTFPTLNTRSLLAGGIVGMCQWRGMFWSHMGIQSAVYDQRGSCWFVLELITLCNLWDGTKEGNAGSCQVLIRFLFVCSWTTWAILLCYILALQCSLFFPPSHLSAEISCLRRLAILALKCDPEEGHEGWSGSLLWGSCCWCVGWISS